MIFPCGEGDELCGQEESFQVQACGSVVGLGWFLTLERPLGDGMWVRARASRVGS